MAKPGLDGHDRGIKILAKAYRDSGMEVIYLGLRQTPQMIVNAAIQEDVDVIALSILSGAHMTIFPKVLSLLKKEGVNNILITGGGIIPEPDIKKLQKIDFDIIFIDPPYKEKKLVELLNQIISLKILKKTGVIIIHRHKKEEEIYPEKFKVLKIKSYGISKIIFGN